MSKILKLTDFFGTGRLELVMADEIARVQPEEMESDETMEVQVTRTSGFGPFKHTETTTKVVPKPKLGSQIFMKNGKDSTYVSESPEQIYAMMTEGSQS